MSKRSTRIRNSVSRYDPSVYDSIKKRNSLKTCCICFNTIGKTNVFITECNHKFCGTCILKHICESNLCPLCRHKLTNPIKKSRY